MGARERWGSERDGRGAQEHCGTWQQGEEFRIPDPLKGTMLVTHC